MLRFGNALRKAAMFQNVLGGSRVFKPILAGANLKDRLIGCLALLWQIVVCWVGNGLIAVWASSGWRAEEEVEDGLSDRWHAGLWWGPADSFFSVPLP
jgi:hypothetical protein